MGDILGSIATGSFIIILVKIPGNNTAEVALPSGVCEIMPDPLIPKLTRAEIGQDKA
jgi:hypothetical protein